MKKILLLLLSLLLIYKADSQQTKKIVCIGNSISQGSKNRGVNTTTNMYEELSYRFWLWEKLDSLGWDAQFVGSNNIWFNEDRNNLPAAYTSRYTGHTFPRNHEAYYGIKSAEFVTGFSHDGVTYQSFTNRLQAYTPDIALIHIGTNDASNTTQEVDQTEAHIKAIIDALRAKNPNVTILIAKLITTWSKINERVDGIAASKSTSQSKVISVDMMTGFINDPANANTMTYDWVHPNTRGQKFMAVRWYNALMSLAPDSEKPTVPTGLKVSATATNTITLSWNAATDNMGIGGYNIYKDGVKKNKTPIAGLTYVVDSLTPVTSYLFTVQSVDFSGNVSDQSSSVSGTTQPFRYRITFVVKDNNAALLQGASINFSGKTFLTDVTGKAVFDSVVASTSVMYTITKTGFQTNTGTVDVNRNQTKNISMVLSTNMTESEIQDEVYPNPTQGKIYFKSTSQRNIELVDVTGNVVLSLHAVTDFIDISAFSKGIYFMKIKEKETVKILKIIKE